MQTSWMSVTHEYRLKVEQDTDPMDPREWEGAGTMVCWHNRYNLGDTVPKPVNGAYRSAEDALLARIKHHDSDQFFQILATEKVSSRYPMALLLANAEKLARAHYIILPLYLYDHSGITMRTGSFADRWDSGQVGWIYFDKAKLKTESWTVEQATKYLEGEVETYDQYLTGDVWRFSVERRPLDIQTESAWNSVDSCGGFFGSDPETNGMKDYVVPQHYIDADAKKLLEEQLREEELEVYQVARFLEAAYV